MKKVISFSLFVFILAVFASIRVAQAQVIVARPVGPRVVIAAPVYSGPHWGMRAYRRAPFVRPVAIVRPRFYPRPFVGVRARVW